MRPSLPYALVGVGGFGRQHLATLTQLEQEGAIRLVAVCDPGLPHLPDLTAGLRARGVRLYEHFDDLLAESSDFAAITIAAPIPYHLPMARACLERGLFIYLEKPPVPLLTQWQELVTADRDAKIAVGFQLIESDWSQRLKRQILDGAFGELQAIRVAASWPRDDTYYRRGRWAGQMTLDGAPIFDGPATNALAHLIHQTMFLASGELDHFDTPTAVQGALYRARPIASYDTAGLHGRFASGVTFSAAFTHASYTKLPYKIKIIGRQGWAEVSQDGELVTDHRGDTRRASPGADPFRDSYLRFLRYATGQAPRPSTFLRDTQGYLATTNGALLSSQTIHQIAPPYFEYLEDPGLYAITDINHHIETSLETGNPFPPATLPWVVRTPEINLTTLDTAQTAEINRHF